MKNSDQSMMNSDQSLRTRKQKSREVSSRFLSPIPTSTTPESGLLSPSKVSSPSRRLSTTDTRKHRSLGDSGLGSRGLWASSAKQDTLADHLGSERLSDLIERQNREKLGNSANSTLNRQRSGSDRFNLEKDFAKENHRPSGIGGSARYTGKISVPRKLSTASTSPSSSSNSLGQSSSILPGRYSVDENKLYRKSSISRSDPFLHLDLESEISSEMAKNHSLVSKKTGIEVNSKYLQPGRNRGETSDSGSNINGPMSADYSPKAKHSTLKNAIKRTNSLTGYGNVMSQWALSPGRSGSMESKNVPLTFSNLKLPSSPSRSKGMGKFLSFFKSKKSSSSLAGSGDVESVHQLRMLHNRILQWHYANARADTVNENIINQSKSNMLSAWTSIEELRLPVLHKKLQLQKEKLKRKLGIILQSQIKPLEGWEEMERQHMSAISRTKDCLHNFVCKVPLKDGAKVDMQSASIALRHALDLTASIKLELAPLSLSVESNVSSLSELARVVTHEKLLLEECLELFRTISTLEIEEGSLRCQIIQLNSLQRQQQY